MGALPTIADDVLILAVLSILRLSFPAGRAEVALFRLSAAAHARGIMWVIDATKVAPNLATTARDACLVDALVLLLLLLLGLRGRLSVVRIGGRGGGGGVGSSRRGFAVWSLGLGLGHGVAATASRPLLAAANQGGRARGTLRWEFGSVRGRRMGGWRWFFWLGEAVFLGLPRFAEGEKLLISGLREGGGGAERGLLQSRNKKKSPARTSPLGGRPCPLELPRLLSVRLLGKGCLVPLRGLLLVVSCTST